MKPSTVCLSIGLALVFCWVLTILACQLGFLFEGLDPIFTVFFATGFCTVAMLVTAVAFKRKTKQFTLGWLVSEVGLLALLTVGFLSWFQTRGHMRNFVQPHGGVVHVINGRSIMFRTYVHFTASPALIAAIMQSKELVFVPAKSSGEPDGSAFSMRQRTMDSWDWWEPTTMSNPRFFYRDHTSDAVQGWFEAWWVNGATNEVYALTGD